MKKIRAIKHYCTIKEFRKAYSDNYYIDSNGSEKCDIVYTVVDVEKEFTTFVVEYTKSNEYKPVSSSDGNSIINLSNALVTSLLAKGVTPKVNEIYLNRNGRRKADFEDLASVCRIALLEKDDKGVCTIDYDVTETIHKAFLAVYKELYALGTTDSKKNPRYGMQSIQQLTYNSDGEEITRIDNNLLSIMYFDKPNGINANCIDYNGVTVNRKIIEYVKLKVKDSLVNDRQRQVFTYYLDGVNKSDIAKFVGVSRPTIYKDIAVINKAISEIALTIPLFKPATVK